ncbi:class I SAM-dependent methyltransferase [Mumia quercus]|uniref:class I SAM-dependent methyltransferase n=1 Tax=Mumia quercus TaxID=2976125 RepID=UPI0021D218FA|nr:class I SAM-dependent methyltransferase [Mumia quercus]
MESAQIRNMADLEDRHWWFRERRHLIGRAIRGLTPGRALDIGAGAGGNTRVVEAAGWQATALEYSDEGVALAKERGLDVVQGDARDIPFPDDHFGLVVAYDVLEHIEEDERVVEEIARVAGPGAKVLIAVPADPRLWSAHDEAVGHVRRYTRATLVGLFDSPRFTIDDVRSWNVLLRPVVALRRRSVEDNDLTALSPVVNAGLSAIIRAERHLPVRSRSGVSLLLEATVR